MLTSYKASVSNDNQVESDIEEIALNTVKFDIWENNGQYEWCPNGIEDDEVMGYRPKEFQSQWHR